MKHWKRIRALLAVILVAVMLVQMSVVAFAEPTSQNESVITETVVTEPVVEQEAQIIAELTDERTEYEKRFMLSNGSMMAVQYAMPVHFLGDDGNWIQYDNRMQETSSILDTDVENSSSTEYRVIESDSDVRLSKKAGDKKIVTIAKDGHQISWGFVGVNKVELELTNVAETAEGNDKFLNLSGIVQEGWYRDAFENADLQYLILPTGVKENIILKSADAPTEFELEYKFKKLTAVQIDSKTIDLQDSKGNVVYTITAPNMQDANGAWSDALSLIITEQKNNKLIIKLTIDEAWVNSADRAFPVTVDPTFETEQDWGVISSATLVEGKPNTAYGNTIGHLYVGKETSSNFDSTRALIKLNNLPTLTPGDVVVSANMILLEYASYPSIQVNAYKVTSNWTPSTATWNNFANSHSEFVVDYDKTKSGTLSSSSKVEEWCNYWDITQMVREWYNGTSPNYGVMLMSPSENNSTLSRVAYYSSNYIGAKGVIPIFQITYRNNKGLESYWTYSQQSLSNGTTGYINDFSGNLVYQVPVMSESGERMPISVSLAYNAYGASKNNINILWTAQKGNGWRTNWDQYCMPVDALPLDSSTIESLKENDYEHVYIDGDGTMHYFKEKKDSSGNGTNIFEDEDGLCMTLTLNPSEFRSYKISCKDGSYMIFDFAGALSSISDSDGNTATAYRAYTQDVSHIIDGAGRTTTFEYVVINGENHLKRVIAPSTHVTTFEYDDNGSLTDVIYNDGTKVCFEYETETINDTTYYLIDKAIDIDGSYLEYEYSQSLAEAQRTQVTSVQEYSAPLKNPDGSLKRDSENNLEYNEGNRIEVDYNLDNTTRYTYICGSDSMWALYEFDNLGRTVCVRNKDGSFSQVGYASGENDKPNRISRASAGEEYVNNLLLDSSAENSTLGWTATATSNVVDTENYFLGYKSLKVTAETATTRTGYYQNVSVIANKDYTFSTYVKTDNVTATGTNGAGMYVKFYDASNNEIANSAQQSNGVRGTNGWQRINFTFKTPAGAVKARVFLVLMSATGTAYFDCAQLEDGNTMNDYNMLQNSSFSSATGWTMSGLASGDGVTANGKLKITGSASQNRSATQTVQINRQKTSFTFSAVAEGNSVPLTDETRAFGVKVKVYFSNGESREEIAYFNTATSAVQKASATFMIPKDYQTVSVTYVEYSLIYNNNANSVEFSECMLTFDETGTTYTYIGDEVITSSDNASRNTTYNFNDAHELTSCIDSKNETYTYTYDSVHKHRMTSARIEALNNLGFTYTYDDYGNVTGVKMGNVSSAGVLDTSSLYIQSSTQYDSTGNYVTSVTDQRGNTTNYDVNTTTGLTNSVEDAENNVVSYTYYPDSFLPWTVSSQRVSGSTTSTETVTYAYDDYNRLETINHNGFDYGFNYDDFGNTTSITVADRTLVTNVYADNNSYLTSKVYGDNTDTDGYIDNDTVYTYTYDKYGRVTSVAVNGITKFNTVYNKKGQVAYIYDVANNRKLVYTYDISGRVLSLTYTGYATISTNYDELDRPIGVTYTFAGQEKSLSFNYGPNNRKGTAVLLSGATRTTVYDSLSREVSSFIGNLFRGVNYTSGSADGTGNKTTTLPSEIVYYQDGINLLDVDYIYDNIGNISSVTQNGVTTTYFYDTLNQLTRAQSSDGTVTKYFYYDGGNIHYKVNADGSKTFYVYDETWKDLLVSFGGQSITYDEIGNPISYLGNTMSWTGRQLDSITKADGTQISYTYDLDGIRTKKTVNGVTTEYFVNGTTILAQKTGNNVIWYIYDSDGEILGFTHNDVAYYYVKNLQGDVLKVIDANGNVVATYTYDPWGKIISSTGTMADINPIRYRGYYYDSETGLYYLNSRYYDPDTCRFVNADGQLNLQEGMTGYNLFQYCGNNPINRMDPNGESFLIAMLIVATVAVASTVTSVYVTDRVFTDFELSMMMLRQSMYVNGTPQRYSCNSIMAKRLNDSVVMRDEIEKVVGEAEQSGHQIFVKNDTVKLYGKNTVADVDLSYSVGEAKYEMTVTKISRPNSNHLFNPRAYEVSVTVKDDYNFDGFRDSGSISISDLFNNVGVRWQNNGTVIPFYWEVSYKTIIFVS